MNFSTAGLFAIFCTQSNDFALGYPIGEFNWRFLFHIKQFHSMIVMTSRTKWTGFSFPRFHSNIFTNHFPFFFSLLSFSSCFTAFCSSSYVLSPKYDNNTWKVFLLLQSRRCCPDKISTMKSLINYYVWEEQFILLFYLFYWWVV
jgi:hypothetical protein